VRLHLLSDTHVTIANYRGKTQAHSVLPTQTTSRRGHIRGPLPTRRRMINHSSRKWCSVSHHAHPITGASRDGTDLWRLQAAGTTEARGLEGASQQRCASRSCWRGMKHARGPQETPKDKPPDPPKKVTPLPCGRRQHRPASYVKGPDRPRTARS
jgi:hypothetical protein